MLRKFLRSLTLSTSGCALQSCKPFLVCCTGLFIPSDSCMATAVDPQQSLPLKKMGPCTWQGNPSHIPFFVFCFFAVSLKKTETKASPPPPPFLSNSNIKQTNQKPDPKPLICYVHSFTETKTAERPLQLQIRSQSHLLLERGRYVLATSPA